MSITGDDIVLIEFGQRLKKARENKGISLRKLEQLAEVDFSQIHRMEKGQINPSLKIIRALAKVLEVGSKDLLDF